MCDVYEQTLKSHPLYSKFALFLSRRLLLARDYSWPVTPVLTYQMLRWLVKLKTDIVCFCDIMYERKFYSVGRGDFASRFHIIYSDYSITHRRGLLIKKVSC